MKDTFIIRTEWADAIFDLDASEQAQLFRNLFHFHSDEQNLINLDNLNVKLVWKIILPNLYRNIDSYDKRKVTSSQNGQLGGRPRKSIDIQEEKPKNNLTEKPNNLTKPNESLSVIDSVSVIDSDNEVKGAAPETPRKISNAEKAWQQIPHEFTNALAYAWVDLCNMRKWKKKSESAIVASFKQISVYPEAFAIELIQRAIAGDYQGLVFDDTPEAYQKWLKANALPTANAATIRMLNPQTGISIYQTPAEHAEFMRKYPNTGLQIIK